jgi:lipoprotein-releasing system permease protein
MANDASRIPAIAPYAEHSFSAFIALRYVSVGRRSQLVSFMSALTVSGLALGIAILITVLSVMNGFDREVRENILGILPHGTVKSQEPRGPEQWQAIEAVLAANPAVLDFAPQIETTGVVAGNGFAKGVLVQGVDPEAEKRISIVDRFMVEGSLAGLQEARFRIILGATLAQNLGVGLGDRVTLYSLEVSVNPLVPLPTQRQFTVTGIYKVGTLELDSAMAMITLQDAQALYRLRDTYTGLRFKIQDLLQVRAVADDLAEDLPGGLEVDTWTRVFGNIYENIQFSRDRTSACRERV